MAYLILQVSGLACLPHPALHNILTTQDVRKLRSHIKFLCGDILTGERLALDQGANPACRLCLATVENIDHIIARCRSTHELRERLRPELLNTVAVVAPTCKLLVNPASKHLTQFLLDCTSLTLPNPYRLSPQNSEISKVFKIARDWCHAITNERFRQLKSLKA